MRPARRHAWISHRSPTSTTIASLLLASIPAASGASSLPSMLFAPRNSIPAISPTKPRASLPASSTQSPTRVTKKAGESQSVPTSPAARRLSYVAANAEAGPSTLSPRHPLVNEMPSAVSVKAKRTTAAQLHPPELNFDIFEEVARQLLDDTPHDFITLLALVCIQQPHIRIFLKFFLLFVRIELSTILSSPYCTTTQSFTYGATSAAWTSSAY
jgi:hypothetical protein